MIDLSWIQRLIDMVESADIDALEVSRWGTRVRISKSPPVHVGSVSQASGVHPGVPSGAAVPVSAGSAGSAGPDEPGSAASGAAELVEIISPMVGTFYRSPAPDAPAYVEKGDHITKGQTVCILEAMKLMNELEAEIAGTIREVCAENAEPVEYGQVLYRVEPD